MARILTSTEAAHELGIGRSSLWRLTRSGAIKGVLDMRAEGSPSPVFRYPMTALDEFRRRRVVPYVGDVVEHVHIPDPAQESLREMVPATMTMQELLDHIRSHI